MYCKKNVSLKKQRNQDAPFCSPYCKDLAVEVLPPAFTLIQGKWASAGLDRLLLHLANSMGFVKRPSLQTAFSPKPRLWFHFVA